MRVGALDGRQPVVGKRAMQQLKAALQPEGLLYIDDCQPISGMDIEV